MADPATDIQKLGTEYPIALLPVRIETRFIDGTPPVLRIRVYPDEIAADLHELALTEAEREAGRDYWTEAWKVSEEPNAWRRLVATYNAPRAAWIVRKMEPSNSASRPAGNPTFPSPPTRAERFAAATAKVLPDAWVAIAYRDGAEIHRVTSADVADSLQLSFRPDVAENDASLVAKDELKIEPELAWAIDFDRAVAVGMAMTMPLTAADVTRGFDRLLVLGVKAKIEAAEGAVRLAALLDAHHYSRGLALVRQGTPTNSSAAAASGYPSSDNPDRSFAIERGPALATAETDGAQLARALGLPAATFDQVEGADRKEQKAARAMNQALWPATLGYFLEQMMSPLLTAEHVADVRHHFREFVRGRGPCPAFRIGRVPYGLLPVSSIQRWEAPGVSRAIHVKLRALLTVWRRKFRDRIPALARVGKTSDPDADLLGVLALDASCREVRLRETLGPAHLYHLMVLRGIAPGLDDGPRSTLVTEVLTAAGLGGTAPRVADMTWADVALRIGRPFASSEPLSEAAALTDNYIAAIRDAKTISDLQKIGQDDESPLLLHLLRQAALVEYGRIGLDVCILRQLAVESDRKEVELFRIGPGTETRKSHWDRLAAPIANLTGGKALGDWLLAGVDDTDRHLVEYHRARLTELAPLPTAELERLFTETLDTCSHRLDAWITSVATRRLDTMRESHPTGVHLGAFAWVEGLRPRTASDTAGGFIHAPSSAHAAAAAILRNAHLTRSGTARDQVTVDLSSARVQQALRLLDGVRQGQPPAAVLGYRFERALHDANLDQYIARFRKKYPLGRDPASSDDTDEQIAARDVVNGLALRTALKGASRAEEIPWSDLPPVAISDHPALAPCLLRLDADVDAAADLLVAESVYQAVQGNFDRAGATLAMLGGGAPLPEPQVVATPRSGTSFTQRVAIVLGMPGGGAAGWSTTSPRHGAEPRLDAWLGTLLGSPATVSCRVSYAAPTPSDASHREEATLSLAELGLCPLDVLALARRTGVDGGGELDARIAWRLGAPGLLQIDHGRDPASPSTVTFPELLEMARLLGEVIAAARPLAAADLLIPGAADTAASFDDGELAGRLGAARTALGAALAALGTEIAAAEGASPPGLAALRTALWAAAAFGVREAVPVHLSGEEPAARPGLVDQAKAVLAELTRRHAATDTTAPGSSLDKLAILFGPELPVLPVFAPGNRAALEAPATSLGGDADAVRKWFERTARVRPPLGQLRLAALATEATSGAPLDFQVAQLSPVADARWIGLPFDRSIPAQRPRAGTLSLALHRAFTVPGNGTWAGLLLDEWAELIPADTQMTAFAVHHDAPGAEAAQCVLLAVPPTPAIRWDLPSLVDILHESLDLAAIRAVDSDHLGDFALLAPTIYLAANVADETISFDLAAQRIAETTVLTAES